MMVRTVTDYAARHWITHNSGVMQYGACNKTFGETMHPSVEMPGGMVDCKRCAAQLAIFEMETDNVEIGSAGMIRDGIITVISTRTHELEA